MCMRNVMLLACFLALWANSGAAEDAPVTGQVIVNEGPAFGWTRLLTEKIAVTDQWTEHTVTFTAPHAGKVQFLVNSLTAVTWFDGFSAEGTTLANGSFEEVNDQGLPAGWQSSKPIHIEKNAECAKDGERFLKSGTNYLTQWLVVEANQPVTVRFHVRHATPPESMSDLSPKSAAAKPMSPESEKLGTAVECAVRNGLPNFIAKCNAGGSVRVAYLGGSITAQAGWRLYSQEIIRRRFPAVTIEEVYAAIGGTGADLGVFRLDRDVIQHKPDLLFIEFASNGGSRKAMEGIIRNTWAALPETDICMVYTVAGAESQRLLESGKLNRNASDYDEMAAHYGIPSIHFGVEAARLAKEGKLAWKASKALVEQVAGKELDVTSGVLTNQDGTIPFSGDGVHPYLDTGHKLYAAAFERSFRLLCEHTSTAGPHTALPIPLEKNFIQNVVFLDVPSVQRNGDWSQVQEPGKKFTGFSGKGCPDLDTFLPSVWVGRPGSKLSFSCTGKSMMLYAVLGPGTGMIEISVGGKTEKRTVFDGYGHVWRLYPITVSLPGDQAAIHDVTVTVLADAVDKASVLATSGQQQKLQTNPDAYKPTDFVLGGICIEGGNLTNRDQ